MALVLAGGIWVATPPAPAECSRCSMRCINTCPQEGCVCFDSGTGRGTCVSIEYRR